MEVHVSIQGSCVIRDAIEFNNHNNEICVDRFSQFINPMTMFAGRPCLNKELKWEKMKGSPFSRRCMQHDFEKSVFSYLGECHSDFILIDISSLVNRYFRFENGVSFSAAKAFWDNEEEILGALSMRHEDLLKYEKSIFDVSLNEIKEVMRCYALEICKQYKPSQIVCVEVYLAEKYIDLETGEPTVWWNNMTPTILQNCVLKAAFTFLVNEMKPTYVISWPNREVYGKADHKWGKYQLHFQDEYYSYLYKEFCKIVELGEKNGPIPRS